MKAVSAACASPDDCPSARALLREHAFLLLRRWQDIRATPRFFFAAAGRCHVLWAFSGAVPLGVLVHQWRLGQLSALCPRCDQMVLIQALSGSALSGSHSWVGVCRGCQREIGRRDVPDEKAPEFSKLWRPLVDELNEHRNERVIKPGQRRRFDWGQGLVGIRTPDHVIRPQIDAMPLSAVIDVLRGGPGRVAVRWPDGEVAYWFDWADQVVRTPDGSMKLRLDNGRVLDGADSLVWTWDSLYLHRPDGEIEYEVAAQAATDPVRGGKARLTSANVAALWGGGPFEAGWRTTVGPFDGVPQYEIQRRGVCRYDGTPLVAHDAEIPLPVALWVALRVRPGR